MVHQFAAGGIPGGAERFPDLRGRQDALPTAVADEVFVHACPNAKPVGELLAEMAFRVASIRQCPLEYDWPAGNVQPGAIESQTKE